jgi:hypothetical protein
MNQRSVSVRRGGLIVLTVGLLLLVPAVIALVSSLSFFGKAERAEAVFGGAVLRKFQLRNDVLSRVHVPDEGWAGHDIQIPHWLE